MQKRTAYQANPTRQEEVISIIEERMRGTEEPTGTMKESTGAIGKITDTIEEIIGMTEEITSVTEKIKCPIVEIAENMLVLL